MLKLVTIPNKILTTPTKKITDFDDQLARIVKDMIDVLDAQKDPPGVGLASTQVGINKSLFIMRPTPHDKVDVCINPEIIELEKTTFEDVDEENEKDEEDRKLEGCLSIPRVWSPVVRPNRVHLRYQTITGEIKEEWFEEFKATIVQHEVDHLNGILFTRRAVEQNAPMFEERKGKLKRIKNI
ncbi:MAG: peptide deformylase [Candidatus Roizmanbacteria bacterium]